MDITYTFEGDSTTARDSSWRPHIVASDLVQLEGVAISGATSAGVLAQTKPVDADVVVIMLGINDIRLGKSRASIKANIKEIVSIVGARHVLLCAIAPNDITDYGSDHIDRQNLGFALNRDLAQLAADNGWLFADPWSAVRLKSNGWVSGADEDGVHPTEQTSIDYIAPRMTTYIRQAARGAAA